MVFCPKVYVSDLRISEIQVLKNINIDGAGIEVDNIAKENLNTIVGQLNKIVKPFAVSIISGVRYRGNLSPNKLDKFLQNIKTLEA
ncbi:hypothetical protein DESAMIL20_2033 [Desulfurella amilsii]|uniref:Uncharacterized protein n=1 Tax=Desulfurella amilsii TaxID=1562698 RepID=A0A1X4XU76_9BACT|nr:hypothetical protein [Desulfurella amilsii]OSS41095.1 hypothetical protein DESAMIL20_2033 [Desulfurella amilsii]